MTETPTRADDQLIEEIHQLNEISLGEGAAMCQVCGSPFNENDAVVVCVFRAAGESVFQVGDVVCGGGVHELLGGFTLGVRELVVRGRVRWCSDEATESSWPVLVAPEVVAVSATATKSIRLLPDETGEVGFRGDVAQALDDTTSHADARGDQQ